MEGDKPEAVVVIEPDVVQDGRKQKDIAILIEQGFVISRQKTFQMSPNQTRLFCGGVEKIMDKFGRGPVCAMIIHRKDDRSPLDVLREIDLDTIFYSDSTFATLRAKACLFPAPKQFERTFVVASGSSAVAELDEIIKTGRFIELCREQRALSAEEARILRVQTSYEQKTVLALEKMGAVLDLILAVGSLQSSIFPSWTLSEADRAINMMWPEGFPLTRTLGLLKPDVVKRGEHHAMMLKIVDSGFTIIAQKTVHLTEEKVAEFYAEHKGKPFYDGLIEFMSSGPLVALILTKPNAVSAWRTMLGPTNSKAARETAPDSLRAQYGTDGRRNAGHGSDSPTSAAREMRFFFPEIPSGNPQISPSEIYQFLTAKPDFRRPHDCSLNQVLVRGLTALCRTKPVGLTAISELGIWLRDNNPRQPKTIVAKSDGRIVDTGTTYERLRARASTGKIRIIFVLGGPGSGKGTQCELMKDLGYFHISSGDLLRVEIASKTVLGRSIQDLMVQGKLVDDEIILELLEKAMLQSGASTFIIDGFPSRIDQGFKFEERIAPCDMVLYFEASDEVLIQRQQSLETRGRVDDNEQSTLKRIATFKREQLPAIRHYTRFNMVHVVDASKSKHEMFAQVKRIVAPTDPNTQKKKTVLQRLQEKAGGSKIEVVFVLGGPGSGKGTQCDLLRSQLGYYHISSGDLLRAEIASKTERGVAVQELIVQGKLVDDDLILTMIEEAMLKSGASKFLIDGFPRRLDQAFKFEKRIAKCDIILYFDAPDNILLERLLDRGKSSGRSDDNTETITKRLRTFHEESLPVVQHYQLLGRVKSVNALQSKEAVFSDVKHSLAPDLFRNINSLMKLRSNAPGQEIQVVFVLGGPGSGKGTQCDLIKSQLGYYHISSGDLLRAEIAARTPLGLSIQEKISQGKLVDDDLILTLIEEAMIKSNSTKFLIDGYPRRLDQAFKFEQRICKCDAVLYFEASNKVLTDRLLERGKSSGRSDDNAESIKKRLVTFACESQPAVNYYQRFGKVHAVNAIRTKETIFADVQRILSNIE